MTIGMMKTRTKESMTLLEQVSFPIFVRAKIRHHLLRSSAIKSCNKGTANGGGGLEVGGLGDFSLPTLFCSKKSTSSIKWS